MDEQVEERKDGELGRKWLGDRENEERIRRAKETRKEKKMR